MTYKGSEGRLRVSMRHLDEASSTDAIPVHSFDRVEKLASGEIACVDIDLFLVGFLLNPGEQLRLVVSGYNILGDAMPRHDNVAADNHGQHVIRTGGHYASYLQLAMKSDVAKPE